MNASRLLVLLLLCACHPEQNRPVAIEKLRFATTDASVIYFKNIRQSEYRKQELKEARAYLYTHKRAMPSTPSLLLFWRNSQAYLLLPDSLQHFNEAIFTTSARQDTVSIDLARPAGQTHFAVLVYNHVLENGAIAFYKNHQTNPFLDQADEREVFRRVVFDFLRLVELR